MTKKICTLLLALTLAYSTAVGVYAQKSMASSVTTSESEEDSYSYEDWEYVIREDGSIQIVQYTGSDTEITIPSEIDAASVTSIGYAGYSIFGEEGEGVNETVTSVTIPDTVVEIGDCTFSECFSLKNVTIPDSVTVIGSYAFSECTSLKSITIPSSVTEIHDGAFSGCTSLKSVKIGNSVTSIADYAFANCTSLKSVKIPKSVETIGEFAFGYIPGSKWETDKSFTIKCCSGSAGAKYAKDNKLNYIIIDKKPSTPTIKKANKSKTSVRLYFKSIAGITGYKVQQYDVSTKKWKTIGLSKVSYAEGIGYNYKITGLNSGTKYKFRVQAYTKVSSKKTLKSGWSKTFSVTTK